MRLYMIDRSLRGLRGDITAGSFAAPLPVTPSAPRSLVVSSVVKAAPTAPIRSGSTTVSKTVLPSTSSSWRDPIIAAADAFRAAAEQMAAINTAWGTGTAGRNVLASARSWAEASRVDTLDRLRARLMFFGRIDPVSIGTRAPGAAAARDALIAAQEALINVVQVGGASPSRAPTLPGATFGESAPSAGPVATAAAEAGSTLEQAVAARDASASPGAELAPAPVYGSGNTTFSALGSFWERYRWWTLSLAGGALIALFFVFRRR